MGLVVKANVIGFVRKYNSEKKLGIDNIAGDFVLALDEKVRKIIIESVERAKANNRKTLMGRDV